jgi:Quinolinate phosphoribosyl transferase, C-terminal domain
LADALAGRPDIVLLDNMDVATLRECVALRDRVSPGVQLEASGGIRLVGHADFGELSRAASVVSHAVGILLSAARARRTLARISSALAVQTNDFGEALWRLM